MINIKKYVGIPFLDCGRDFEGMDCLGLILRFYKDELGIILHDPEVYESAHNIEEVEKHIQTYGAFDEIVEVPRLPLQLYDVMAFKIRGHERHVGLYIGNSEMLHLMQGSHACIERIDGVKWSKIHTRTFRHVASS